MRLIDVDELLQKVGNVKVTDDIYYSISQIYETIKNQPTTYDVEKVVAELKKQDDDCGCGKISVWDAIDIVKNGGVVKRRGTFL
jgi:hypothetical protein